MPDHRDIKNDVDFAKIAQQAVSMAHRWAKKSAEFPENRSEKLLSKVLAGAGGLDFTVQFVDGVIRPEDSETSARNLQKIGGMKSDFLPTWLQVPAKAGGAIAPLSPTLITNTAFQVFRRLVGNLVLDTTPKKLGPAVKKLRADGSRLNLNLLGEAVLGNKEATYRLNAVQDLLEHDFVDYVSIKVSSVLGAHNPWAYDQAVAEAVEALVPLYETARKSGKFVNLDMEEYHDLHMTIAVFQKLLERPEFKNLKAGIVLQAYLPDALDAMIGLQEWAAKRVAEGGAPIKVRLVKGANLPMERVDAAMHGWALAVQPSKAASDANYIRVLEYALRPEHIKNVELGIAGQNLFTLGFGLALAKARGITDGYDVEMLKGMAMNQARAIREDVGQILYYVPVVDPANYDVAISYLVRRLEESAAPENFMSGVFQLAKDRSVFSRERKRFATAVVGAFPEAQLQEQLGPINEADLPELHFGPNRQQNRLKDAAPLLEKFANIPDSDPSLPANIEWARQIFAKIPTSNLGTELADASRVFTAEEITEIHARAAAAQPAWGQLSGTARAEILRRAGQLLNERRAEFIEVAASECGKILGEADIEVSEAIDFCNYYADLCEELENTPGVTFTPETVTAAIPPWNFPIAIPTGSVVAPLATGSAVLFKPAEQARRCGAVIAQALWDAGVPREVLNLIDIHPDEMAEVGKALVTSSDQVILTGSIDTATMFRSWQPDLKIAAETSGKNAIVVTSQADIDLAAKDIVNSAFGHAGQKCSAASLLILVGAIGKSKRLLNQVVDAAESLVVDWPHNPKTEMGPVIEPAAGKLLRGLTELEPGQRWLLQPRQLDDTGRLWSPGIRDNVKPGDDAHRTEYFGPVLSIIRCETLDEAIEIQNAVDFGLTAGIHTLSGAEIAYWLERVQAGNVYINRGITGAIVRRQPFGGWKLSQVGTGSKAGGPNHLIGLSKVAPNPATRVPVLLDKPLTGIFAQAETLISRVPAADKETYQQALFSAAQAWETEYGFARDVSQLGVEKNIFRYRPTEVLVRLADPENWWQAAPMIAGALTGGTKITVSVADDLRDTVARILRDMGAEVRTEDTATWLAALAANPKPPHKIRYFGTDPQAVAQAVNGSVDVAIYSDPATFNGRVDLRPFFLEQAVAATNHRFGDHTTILDGVL
ncbi:bifunctional proline dehydrogenase/L-glutamate gamma-semialdehyde dehydrogenase [Corynebacterium caspium]|uniref:bifunctional proline dehydrogenase/L-glutamate gamma-semialdehyde dehydrogenase n=1 Tax=Corynebacterium caspium TaxID=234828 RepID=UPI000370BC90|nr:bifunctional proline dehydrogenase/L-glutamate gamma-semialdehyde dehydrogenase [Corynebacterium caspium]WKD58603.1 1-pyrroline-5-carboxylate dehydrogenase 1 [Corynebacterium caspium DSM 44850]